MTAAATSFPRVSPSGTLILITYLSIAKASFDASIYGLALHSSTELNLPSSLIMLNGMVAATSFLNVISHGAVVLGALNDTYVLSIVVGVGFDVLTQLLRLVWWVQLSFAVGDKIDVEQVDFTFTIVMLLLLSVIYVYHMTIHVRALRMNHSTRDRLLEILLSALNNLRGIPGEGYKDHIFAYTDLGGHLAPLYLSIYFLRRHESLLLAFWMLVFFLVASVVILSRVPFNDIDDGRGNKRLVVLSKGSGHIECLCKACTEKSRLTGKQCSFTLTIQHGVCRLWLYSFGELFHILSDMKD